MPVIEEEDEDEEEGEKKERELTLREEIAALKAKKTASEQDQDVSAREARGVQE